MVDLLNIPMLFPFTFSRGGCGTREFALYNGDGFRRYSVMCYSNYWTFAWDSDSEPLGSQKCSDLSIQN